jgi:hypothetical protein
MHNISLVEQQLGQERAILTGDAGDKRNGFAHLQKPLFNLAQAKAASAAAQTISLASMSGNGFPTDKGIQPKG